MIIYTVSILIAEITRNKTKTDPFTAAQVNQWIPANGTREK
jgi:hypothetical protein